MKNSPVVQWLLLGAALLLLGCVIGFNLHHNRQQIMQQEGQRILTQTRVIARNMEYQFKTTNLALQDILDDLPYLTESENFTQATARFTVLADALPGVRTIFLTDAEGTIKNANRMELIGKNISYRDYFTEPLKHPDPAKFYISPPFKTVLNSYTFNISRMITGPDGKFAGVVTAGIEPEYFEVLLQSVLYAPDMIVTINHGDGLRFMILPQREGQAGKNLAVPGSMFTRHKESNKPENIYIDTGYATGEYRMMALVTLNSQKVRMDKPPCIIAGRKMSEILMSWQREALLQGVSFVLVCAISGAGLLMVQRRQARILQAEQELAESRQRFVDIFEFMPDATFVVDHDRRVIAWNRAMEQMTGVPKEAMLGQGDNAYSVPFYGIRRPLLLDLLLTEDNPETSDYQNISSTGTTFFAEAFCPALNEGKGAYIWEMAAAIRDPQGNVMGAIESVRDISATKQLEADLKQSNELLASQARFDFLTGIYNRMMFNELLLAELARSCRYATPVSLIMFDLDHFKRINDTLGHSAGDHVLKEIARLVTSRIRAHDVFSRWGGEEFLILAPKNDVIQAARLAEILREMIAGYDFGEELRVTASFGVTCHTCGEAPESFIERADAALYQAKHNGRNRVEVI